MHGKKDFKKAWATFCILFAFLAFIYSAKSYAQNNQVNSVTNNALNSHNGAQPQDTNKPSSDQGEEGALVSDVVGPDDVGTLFFVNNEFAALMDAKKLRGSVRPPRASEINNVLKPVEYSLEKPKPPPAQRELSLGGILYSSKDDWTIWLNGKRVTPTAIPSEVLGMQVFNQYIEMRWLDDWSGQIFPIRLRPHERFNMDTRIYLPGTRQ